MSPFSVCTTDYRREMMLLWTEMHDGFGHADKNISADIETNTVSYFLNHWLTVFIVKLIAGLEFGYFVTVFCVHWKTVLVSLFEFIIRIRNYFMRYHDIGYLNGHLKKLASQDQPGIPNTALFSVCTVLGNLPERLKLKDLQEYYKCKNTGGVIEIMVDPKNKSERRALMSLPYYKTHPWNLKSMHNKTLKGHYMEITEIKKRKYIMRKGLDSKTKRATSSQVDPGVWSGVQTSQYTLIDTGNRSLLTSDREEITAILQRSISAGVKKIIITCTTFEESVKASKMCEDYPGYLYFTTGVHSRNAYEWEESIPKLEKLAKHPQCVAIGHIGCHIICEHPYYTVQVRTFRSQVEIACRLKKPVCCYVSGCYADFLSVLKRYKDQLPAICLTFDVNQPVLKKYLHEFVQLGCYISFSGYGWHRKRLNILREMLEKNQIPLNRIVLQSQTPSPGLETVTSTLEQLQNLYPDVYNKVNITEESYSMKKSIDLKNITHQEPCYLPFLLELVSLYADCPPKMMSGIVNNNAQNLFDFRDWAY